MSVIVCPRRDELVAWSLGQLSSERLEAITDHLERCSHCSSLLATLDLGDDSLLDDLRAAPERDPHEQESGCRRALDRFEAVGIDPDGALLAAGTAPEFVAGGRIGSYLLLEQLARGGMGTVYRARHTLLNREVALKLMPTDRLGDRTAVARFRREIASVAKLEHPNIVHANDAGEAEGQHYLVMEFVEGADLSRLVKQHGPLPVNLACEVVRQAALGLEQIHQHSMVHRDVKPSNLIVSRGGQVKLLDLGLALLRQARSSADGLTEDGQVMGSLDYIAPEQISDTHRVDHRADLYSLGCTFYHLLTGHPPFHGPGFRSSFEKMQAHLSAPAPLVRSARPDVSEALARMLDRLLAKRPEERYATAAELASDLAPYSAGSRLSDLFGETPVRLQTLPGFPGDPMRGESTTTAPLSPHERASGHSSTVSDDLPVPARTAASPGRSRIALATAVATILVFLGALLAWQVIVHIKDRSGKTIQKMEVPEGGVVEVEGPEGKVAVVAPPRQPREVAPTLKSDRPGEPLSPLALVREPAPLPGVKGWTLETTGPRGRTGLGYGTQSVVFDPGGRRLAILGQDGTIRIWDTDSGKLIRVFLSAFSPWHGSQVPGMAWSRDGRLLAAASSDGLIRFWEVSTGRILRTWTVGDGGGVTILAWSPDGETIGVGICNYGSVKPGIVLWDVKSGKPTDTMIPVKINVTNAVWSPDSQNLAIHDQASGEVVVWRRDSGQVESVTNFKGSYDSCLAWSTDSRLLACGTRYVPLQVFDIKEHRLLGSVGETPKFPSVARWLDDGKSLALEGKVWKVDSGKVLKTYTAGNGMKVSAQAWSPDGSMWVSFRPFYTDLFELHDFETDKVRLSIRTHPAYNPVSGSWSLSPEGKTLALNSTQGKAWLWNVRKATQPRSIQLATNVGAISWFPDNRRLAHAYQSMWLYDVETGRLSGEADLAQTQLTKIACSPEGKTIAGVTGDRVKLFAIESLQSPQDLIGGADGRELVWSPNGKVLATSFSGGLRLVDPATGQVLLTIKHEGVPYYRTPYEHRLLLSFQGHRIPVAWSPDGKLLAVPDKEGVKIWDIALGQVVQGLFVNAAYVTALRWSADGKVLAALDWNRLLSLWDVATGERKSFVEGQSGEGIITPDLKMVVAFDQQYLRIGDAMDGHLLAVLVPLAFDHYLVISPDGHYAGPPGVEEQLIYVVETDRGQETLTPSEFSAKYGWKNEPARVTFSR